MACLIGIASGTGAGKTTVARLLAERVGGMVDDKPAAIDTASLLAHLRDLAAGRSVPKPLYSFESRCHFGEVSLPSAPVVVVEGPCLP